MFHSYFSDAAAPLAAGFTATDCFSPQVTRGCREDSIRAQLVTTRELLTPVAGNNAALEARLLAAHAWRMTPETLLRSSNDACDAAPLLALVERRLCGEPVAHIIGHKHFWKDVFAVNRHVLTPRADSETMIEALLRLRPDTLAGYRILDLGTGSGCLLLSALREYTNATGLGVDCSAEALEIAACNAATLALSSRSNFLQRVWCEALTERVDIILSNPPYIPTAHIATLSADVRVYEPTIALDGGADGLACYRAIIAQATLFMRPHALVLFEVGVGQADAVVALGEAVGWRVEEIANDLAGIARIVAFAVN